MRRLILIVMTLMIFMVCGQAQERAVSPLPLNGNGPNLETLQPRIRSADETRLSYAVLVFGILAMGLEVFAMVKMGKGWGTDSSRVFGTTMIIVAALFLVTSGYTQDQIAPVVGLLGTIGGFILGKTADAPSKSK